MWSMRIRSNYLRKYIDNQSDVCSQEYKMHVCKQMSFTHQISGFLLEKVFRLLRCNFTFRFFTDQLESHIYIWNKNCLDHVTFVHTATVFNCAEKVIVWKFILLLFSLPREAHCFKLNPRISSDNFNVLSRKR